MAQSMSAQFGLDVADQIVQAMAAVHPDFPSAAFVKEVSEGYESLALMARAWAIAHGLRRCLPPAYPEALEILLASLDHGQLAHKPLGMASFIYLPHVLFVAEYGMEHFEISMHAQYLLTQVFTAEFSIRPYLERYPARTLAHLEQWATDPNVHVRRLVSEGTRPRLPWAPRLRRFQHDPRPVLGLLERLKDDPELYVRRSVANNLNDIGKDHPDLLVDTAARWMKGASAERAWVVRHGLRSAIKRGEPGALKVLGFGRKAEVAVGTLSVEPPRVPIGSVVRISFSLTNPTSRSQSLLVDLKVHFVKANGKTRPKVFKLKTLELAAGGSATFSKKVSLKQLSTRTHFPGQHRVAVMVNGEVLGQVDFEVVLG